MLGKRKCRADTRYREEKWLKRNRKGREWERDLYRLETRFGSFECCPLSKTRVLGTAKASCSKVQVSGGCG